MWEVNAAFQGAGCGVGIFGFFVSLLKYFKYLWLVVTIVV
jgi:hypothetical protein